MVVKKAGQMAVRRAGRLATLMEYCSADQRAERRAARLVTPMDCCSADQRVAKRADQTAGPMAGRLAGMVNASDGSCQNALRRSKRAKRHYIQYSIIAHLRGWPVAHRRFKGRL